MEANFQRQLLVFGLILDQKLDSRVSIFAPHRLVIVLESIQPVPLSPSQHFVLFSLTLQVGSAAFSF